MGNRKGSKRRGRRNGRAMRAGHTLCNTVEVKYLTSSLSPVNLTVDNLIGDAITGERQVVPISFLVEYLPTLVNTTSGNATNVLAQPAMVDVLGTSETTIPFGPYRLLSNINPVRYSFNCRAKAKTVSPICRPVVDADRAVPILRLRFSPFALGDERTIFIRVTSHWDILPQENIVQLTSDRNGIYQKNSVEAQPVRDPPCEVETKSRISDAEWDGITNELNDLVM